MKRKLQYGFSLLEMMAATSVILIVTGIVMSGMGQMMKTQGTIANRTEMHAGVRSATELLQQEIGQAGKVSLGDPNANISLHAAVLALGSITLNSTTLDTSTGGATPTPCTICTVYPGEYLTVDVGGPSSTTNAQETVVVGGTAAAPTATFVYAHAAHVPVASLGAFATGIVPPDGTSSGSSGTILKLYGDLNSDGNMYYVEYKCAQGTPTSPGILSRNVMPITAASKTPYDATMILLNNVLANPPDLSNNPVFCFQYQVQALPSGQNVVTDVAVTLTVQTQQKDPQTGQFQPETKALLNISPRNVVEVFDTAKLVDPTRAQPMPASVVTLLPDLP